MANTYESKFKGVEVDEGVNIARNLTGTGGIEVKKTATGTTNATVTIDGSGKQDTITADTNLSLSTAYANNLYAINEVVSNGRIAATGVISSDTALAAPKITGGQLDISGNVGAGNVLVQNQISATGSITSFTSLDSPVVKTLKVAYKETGDSAITLLPDAISVTAPSGVNFSNSITVNGQINGNSGMTLQNGKGITFQSGATKIMGTIMPNTGASGNPTFILPTKGGTLAAIDQQGNLEITGYVSTSNLLIMETPNSDKYVSLDSDWLARYEARQGDDPEVGDSSTRILWPYVSGTGAYDFSIKIPAKSGTIALLSDIGVTSIGGTTGAITLSTGLAMSGQQLVNKVKVYTSGNYLCIDTN